MAGSVKLVLGASGFLGSHVTRQLVRRGDRVRILLRRYSSIAAIDGLDVERHYGDGAVALITDDSEVGVCVGLSAMVVRLRWFSC